MSTSADIRAAAVLARVTEMAYRAMLDYGEWSAGIAPNARLDADLGMQSVELAAFQRSLTQQWGEVADLAPLLRTLDLAGLTELTLGAVATYLVARIAAAGPAGQVGPAGGAGQVGAAGGAGRGAGQ